MIFKIPNILTIGRLILVPFLVFAFFLPGSLGNWLSFSIFVLASFTDFLDGFFARLLKQQSKLGELLDPIADKIIVVTALVLLVSSKQIEGQEVIAAIIIVSREILVSPLDEIPGIGRNRKKTLLNHFGSAKTIEGASLEDLKKVDGISELIAKKIYNYFHLNKNFL